MDGFAEWTFEGGLNPSERMQVGADGCPPVIHRDAYDGTQKRADA